MATLNKFNCFALDVANGQHALGSATLKVMLTNTAPVATNAAVGDISEISAGNGYTAGGNQAGITSLTQTGGTAKLVLANPSTWVATGAVGPFRYAVLYNASNSKLIGWADYGSVLTLASGDQFQAQFDQTNGALTIV